MKLTEQQKDYLKESISNAFSVCIFMFGMILGTGIAVGILYLFFSLIDIVV